MNYMYPPTMGLIPTPPADDDIDRLEKWLKFLKKAKEDEKDEKKEDKKKPFFSGAECFMMLMAVSSIIQTVLVVLLLK